MTYQEIVLGQFRKRREAVWCLRIFAAIFVLATYAPVFALNVPFWTDLPGAPASPWLSALFDTAVFPQAVDAFFNLLMATLPAVVVPWFFLAGRRLRLLLVWSVVHVALFVWILSAREAWRSPVRDYPRLVAEAKASAVFPPIRHHPGRRMSEF